MRATGMQGQTVLAVNPQVPASASWGAVVNLQGFLEVDRTALRVSADVYGIPSSQSSLICQLQGLRPPSAPLASG